MFRPQHTQSSPISIKHRIFSLPTLVSLALGGTFLAFLVTRFDVDLNATWDHVSRSNPWLLVLALLVHYTTFPFRGARWRLLLQNAQGKGTLVPGMLYCSQLLLLGWFANSVSWFRLGDAYRAYLYHNEQEASFSRTIGTILAERVLDTVIVVLLLLVTVPFLVTRNGGNSQTALTSWAVLGIAISVLVLLAVVLLALKWGKGWLLGWLPPWLAERYQRFHEGAASSFRQMPLVAFLGLLGWLAEVGRLYLVVQALDLDLSFALAIFVALANSLLTLVPTPGGFGAVESGIAGLLVRLSTLTTSAAAALVLVDRSISYVSIIITGAILFLVRQTVRRRRRGRT
jgi:uncharacterized membrane protein YbhN (UPF0104 family)